MEQLGGYLAEARQRLTAAKQPRIFIDAVANLQY